MNLYWCFPFLRSFGHYIKTNASVHVYKFYLVLQIKLKIAKESEKIRKQKIAWFKNNHENRLASSELALSC